MTAMIVPIKPRMNSVVAFIVSSPRPSNRIRPPRIWVSPMNTHDRPSQYSDSRTSWPVGSVCVGRAASSAGAVGVDRCAGCLG